MSQRERWLSSISMTVSILPLVIIALVQSFAPTPYVFTDPTTLKTYSLSGAQLNFVGVFCLVPFLIMFITRILKSKGLVFNNFTVVAIATLVMSIMYILVIIFIAQKTIRGLEPEIIFKRVDYVAIICSLICITFALLANFLPKLKPNPIFGVKNSKTMSNPIVWHKVNGTASSFVTYLFLVTAVICAYSKSVLSIVPLLLAIFIYFLWVNLYTDYIYKHFHSLPPTTTPPTTTQD